LASPKDNLHDKARDVTRFQKSFQIVTTDEVLSEFLTFISSKEPRLRPQAAKLTRAVLENPQVIVVAQTHDSFLDGLALYEQRPDKRYSLGDCVSMQTMKTWGLTDALTDDHHFIQEGFRALLKD
jgi:predicted nucleic acid-binding protein